MNERNRRIVSAADTLRIVNAQHDELVREAAALRAAAMRACDQERAAEDRVRQHQREVQEAQIMLCQAALA